MQVSASLFVLLFSLAACSPNDEKPCDESDEVLENRLISIQNSVENMEAHTLNNVKNLSFKMVEEYTDVKRSIGNIERGVENLNENVLIQLKKLERKTEIHSGNFTGRLEEIEFNMRKMMLMIQQLMRECYFCMDLEAHMRAYDFYFHRPFTDKL